jgi:parallel beta-helix repeat protein
VVSVVIGSVRTKPSKTELVIKMNHRLNLSTKYRGHSVLARILNACVAILLLMSGNLSLAGTRYVGLSGDDKNDGKSQQTAWRTIRHAVEQARAGDTVFIKAGNYGAELMKVGHSGTEDKPIVFEGYREKPGDRPFPKYKPGDKPNPTLMPTLTGKETGTGIYLRNKKNIQFRNIAISRYGFGLFALDCERIVLDQVFSTDCYKKEGHSYGVGFYFIGCPHSIIRDCVVADASGDNIVGLRSNFLLIENCRTYGTVEDKNQRPDYYIVIGDSSDCVIRNCLAHNLYPENGGGHGIGIKDQAAKGRGYPRPHSTNNKIVNCTVINSGESLYAAHEAHHNEFIDCTIQSDWRNCSWTWMQGINVRDGAHHNVFRNCRIEGSRYAVVLHDTVEGPMRGDGKPRPQTTRNNSFINCTFSNVQFGFEIWSTENNLFRNCIFSGVDAFMFQFTGTHTRQNVMANCILTNVKGYSDPQRGGKGEFDFISSAFWKNGFKTPAGSGNFESDPLFADPDKNDFHLKSQAGRWTPSTKSWAKDDVTSPCIDAGVPGSSYSTELEPNGGRCNVGTYGDTAEASKSHGSETSSQEQSALDPTVRFKYLLSGAAPRAKSLSGSGNLLAEHFAWLPDSRAAGKTSLKIEEKIDVLGVHLDHTGQPAAKGWLAVNVDSLCDPFTVTAPDRTTTPARTMGRFLLFRAEKAGVWKIEGLPRKGARSIPGKFSCRRFRVTFAGGLQTDVIYQHLPHLKEYRFENDDPDADDEAELSVTVESKPDPLIVKADGQPHEDYERKGDTIHIKGVLPNVTYRIEKLDAASLPLNK